MVTTTESVQHRKTFAKHHVRPVGRPKHADEKKPSDVSPELIALHKSNPKGAYSFTCYDRLTDKVGTEEGKQGYAIVEGIYAFASTHNMTIEAVCKKYIRDNSLDWSSDKFYSLVRQMHSRAAGENMRTITAKKKAESVQVAEAKAKKEGKTAEEVTAAVKAAEKQHAKEVLIKRVIATCTLDDILESILPVMFKTRADVYFAVDKLTKYAEKYPIAA